VRIGSVQPGQDARRPPPGPGEEELEVDELVGPAPLGALDRGVELGESRA
jgi:hypothetical protein